MKKIIAVALIGLLMAAGLVLFGCEGGGPKEPDCKGNGECTVTVGQGSSGLYLDKDSPRSTCGKSATTKWSESLEKYVDDPGCKVQENIDGTKRTYGKHGCDC
jgi:hypothetical protein